MEKINTVVKPKMEEEESHGTRFLKPLPMQLKADPILGDSTHSNPVKFITKSQKALEEALERFQSSEITLKEIAKVIKIYWDHAGTQVVQILDRLDDQQQRKICNYLIESTSREILTTVNKKVVERITTILAPSEEKQKEPIDSKTKINLKKLSESRSLEYLLSEKSGELSNSQINLARKLISQISDTKKDQKGKVQGDYWEKLQEKAVYANQRDVQKEFGEHTNYGAKHITGGTCNLASLAMALSYLGISIPNEPPKQKKHSAPQNAVERLQIYGENHVEGFNRENPLHWGAVAKKLKAEPIDIGNGAQSKEWWLKNVRESHLRKGHAVMCSIQGSISSHIVRLQGIDDDGIVVDDPFGKSTPQKGKNRAKPKSVNRSMNGAQSNTSGSTVRGTTDNDGKAGSDHRWSWDQVIEHEFKWIKAIVRA
jgi:hypothetical protein